jgi:DNA-binding NarL/FixJ family response regulator
MNRRNSGPRTKILIVDDHPMIREGLGQLIADEADLETCGEASTADEALEMALARQPALVVTDISLPGKSGLEFTKDLLAAQPKTLVMVLSMHDELVYAERVLRAGARGYVMKQEGGKRIMEAIRSVLAGKVAVSPKMAARLLETFSGRRSTQGASFTERLTDRELEIFRHLGRGRVTRDIATALHISPKTVEAHRANIKAKLKIGTHAELILRAVQWTDQHAGAEG